jgi:two-component system, cell cycle sensor histidine kinase and response regulator CckA
METRSVNFNRLIEEIAPALEIILGSTITLRLQLHPEAICGEGDSALLGQAFEEIAYFSRQRMPMGGELSIQTEPASFSTREFELRPQTKAGPFVCISFKDTGAGTDELALRHIFEPFPPARGCSMGMALSLAHGIIKQHHGWIEAESPVGEGTVFRLYFPCRTPGERQNPAAAKQPAGIIMIVEDETGLRRLISYLLRRQGYSVIECASAQEALRLWEGKGPEIDLLLTDMMMPGGISGAQLAGKLKEERPSLEIIYTSGYEFQYPDDQKAHFLAKPFPPARLLELVHDCLGPEPTESLPA